MWGLLCIVCFAGQLELGVDLTGTHLHKIDQAPVGPGGRVLFNFTRGLALDTEVTRYPEKTSLLAGIKSGWRFDRFGAFGKVRFGMWHFSQTYFATDLGGVLEYYPSRHTSTASTSVTPSCFTAAPPWVPYTTFSPESASATVFE
jgi:hypothetical protein